MHCCLCQRSVQFTCIVGERASVAVKNEPPFFPGLDLSSHFDQVATAGLLRDGQVVARVCAVARRLNVSPQVKVILSHWQVAGQRARLEAQKSIYLAFFVCLFNRGEKSTFHKKILRLKILSSVANREQSFHSGDSI